MNSAEKLVAHWLEEEGWFVQNRGWPDFLAYHPNGDIRFIEVKRRGQKLHWDQHVVRCRLRELGHNVEIMYVDKVSGDKDGLWFFPPEGE